MISDIAVGARRLLTANSTPRNLFDTRDIRRPLPANILRAKKVVRDTTSFNPDTSFQMRKSRSSREVLLFKNPRSCPEPSRLPRNIVSQDDEDDPHQGGVKFFPIIDRKKK